jgi:glycosyltransferase involved in cell wall biosynthesis
LTLRTADTSGIDAPIKKVPFGGVIDHSPLYYPKNTLYDFLASRYVSEIDLFHGWNDMCLRSLRRANAKGAITVVERASTHPEAQRELVNRERDDYGEGHIPIAERGFRDRKHRRAVAELQECDAVFVPSTFVANTFRERGYREDEIFVIPFGVDTDQFTPPEDPARPDGEFTALFVGTISLRKGIQYLLPAWQKADVDGKLILAGKVTDAASPIVAKYRDDPSIQFVGWVDKMAQRYREANVFVFPSIEEGSALVSYEAMASALPSIVTPNVGSLVESDEHGLVVPHRDIDAVADAIESLASDPDKRRQLGTNARKKVEDYTWDRYGERVVSAYQELLDRR